MASQIGYRAKAYRGASQIPKVRSITPPEPTSAKIDVTHLESTGFTKEYIAGFTDLPEVSYECISDTTEAVQNTIESDFYAGTKTVEAWSHLICDNTTGATLRTYSYTGYISSALRSPIATEEVILLTIKVQLASSVTIT